MPKVGSRVRIRPVSSFLWAEMVGTVQAIDPHVVGFWVNFEENGTAVRFFSDEVDVIMNGIDRALKAING